MAKLYYEYVWEITFNIPSRNIAFRPYALCRFEKHANYFENFIPSYNMICKIFDRDLEVLRFLDKEINVTVKCTPIFGKGKDNLDNIDTDNIEIYEFACYYDKQTIPSVTKSAKTTNESVEKPKVNYEPETLGEFSTAEINFSLLLKDDMKIRTYTHNRIFGSNDDGAAPMSAAMALIEENPFIEKCLVDKPTNTNKYRDLIIKPAELKKALYDIQYNYGIYNKSLELFYDKGMLYMLNKLENHHSSAKDEITEINLRLCERSDAVGGRDYVSESKDNKIIYYERQTKLYKEDYESIEGALNGDKFVYSNFASAINSAFSADGKTQFISPIHEVNRPRSSRVDTGTKMIKDYDMLNNAFNMSSFMYEKSIGVPISFALMSVNAKHFTPNKNFRVLCDTPESTKLYSGLYNIASAEFVYENTNKKGKNFNTFCHVLVKLVNKTEGYDQDYEVGKSNE